MRGAIPLRPVYAFMTWTGKPFKGLEFLDQRSIYSFECVQGCRCVGVDMTQSPEGKF